MRTRAKLSCESLNSYVHSYFYFENNSFEEKSYLDIFPDNYIKMFICYSDFPIQWECNNTSILLKSVFLTGLMGQPGRIKYQGRIRIVGIRFFIWVSSDIWADSVMVNNILPIGGLFDDLYRLLIPAINKSDIEKSFNFLEAFLLETINIPGNIFRINNFIFLLFTNEKISDKIAEIASDAFLSLRQFERVFKREIGVSPKAFIQKARFCKILARIWQDPPSNLTSLALEFDYSSQSHFIHDFKRFARQTPGEFVQFAKQLNLELNNE